MSEKTSEPMFAYPGGVFGINDRMTLHYWFAGMALCGMLAHAGDECDSRSTAHNAFWYADAMMQAMEARKDQNDADAK